MSRTITMFSCVSSNRASPMTSAIDVVAARVEPGEASSRRARACISAASAARGSAAIELDDAIPRQRPPGGGIRSGAGSRSCAHAARIRGYRRLPSSGATARRAGPVGGIGSHGVALVSAVALFFSYLPRAAHSPSHGETGTPCQPITSSRVQARDRGGVQRHRLHALGALDLPWDAGQRVPRGLGRRGRT